ncbi:hypothetical protein DFR71_2724 [Nocardia alba]|uniref:Uncharacterized protein n=2 Tax=Nocardia alba TaxID=225051 RepID=A0A4R1FPZ9_9NOCA|nr:hypothetical protein DFR71_2724 [Nocardia alba]
MNSLLENHRGWVADIFTDGLYGRGDAPGPRGGVADDARPSASGDGRSRRSEDVIGWRALCSCAGWHGRTWLRADRPGDHAPSARVLHCSTGRLDAGLADLVLTEWDHHQLEMQALLPVRLAFEDTVAAQQRLVEAVRFVRATGASWEAVARVISAPSAEAAEERFGIWVSQGFDAAPSHIP